MFKCSSCGQGKPSSEFSKRSGRPRGLQSRCKACQRTRKCADCGDPVTSGATYCMACRFKGDRNPIAGTVRPDAVRAAIGQAQRGVPEPPRAWVRPKDAHAGRGQANKMYAKPDACERCGEKKRLDWHHISGDATDNRRENLAALCRRCHQVVDGRNDFLVNVMPSLGRQAQLRHAAPSKSSKMDD
jgi:hypothetical protein